MYKERIYESYASSHTGRKLGDMRVYAIALRDFRWRIGRLLPEKKDARCLDLACGAGEFLHFLKESGYSDVTGVDVSPEQVALARQVCDKVVQDDVQKFMESHVGYDLISIFSFFEHLSRDEGLSLLDAVYGALNDGGRLILVMPNADSPFASHMRYGDVTHEVIYNRSSLSSFLRAAGFQDLQAFETGPVPHGFVSGIRWILWRGITSLLKLSRTIEGGCGGGWICTTEFIMTARKHEEK